jgi:[acyl-carrier-protein] S-malonyltransferase
MKPAAERLKSKLASVSINAPVVPVVNNIDVRVESDPAKIRDALYRQAFGPVRWFETVQALRALGIGLLVECGPGKVLAGMVKRIDSTAESGAVYDPASLAEVRGLLA